MIVVIAKIPRVFNTGDKDQNYNVYLSVCIAILKVHSENDIYISISRGR